MYIIGTESESASAPVASVKSERTAVPSLVTR
ncbi:hypothetical protein FB385_0103 [Paramicrobacterium agarici]|nr:hypothetical protein FB385_0103 [Microbacterium agarici]